MERSEEAIPSEMADLIESGFDSLMETLFVANLVYKLQI